jgi:hypothetical protein
MTSLLNFTNIFRSTAAGRESLAIFQQTKSSQKNSDLY